MAIDNRIAMEYHLQYNHYPPIDLVFVDTAYEAIAAIDSNDPALEILLPNGLIKSAEDICEDLHLWEFTNGYYD
jgi:hypothetical protein